MKTEVLLRMMTEAEFVTWKAYSIGEYAKDKMQSLGISAHEATKLSEESFASLLADGMQTSDNHFYMVARGDTVIGWLWFVIKTEWGVTSAFVYDVEIRPEFRRQGIGAAAMLLLEAKARERGASKIALHVFGDNTGARALYSNVGYRVTDYSMVKELN